jgi:flagellar hook-associated protein 3 FlgL
MLRSLDASSENFLNNLNDIAARMESAQRKISTGLRIHSVSDDPDQISPLLQARADLAAVTQTQYNLGRVKSEVDAAEQALQQAVSLVERARTLGSQGVTGTATPESRQAIADELGSILESLAGLSRTTVEGRYIFSGDADHQAPYTVDLSQPNPISAYMGSSATREIQHPNGSRFSLSKTAQDIFDAPDPTQNVFYSINALRVALQNNDEDAIQAALPNVITAQTYLNGQLSFYGTVQNKVADATEFANRSELQLKARLSTIEDADLTEAILELNQAQLQQQAALQTRGRMPRTTLFDYLK